MPVPTRAFVVEVPSDFDPLGQAVVGPGLSF